MAFGYDDRRAADAYLFNSALRAAYLCMNTAGALYEVALLYDEPEHTIACFHIKRVVMNQIARKRARTASSSGVFGDIVVRREHTHVSTRLAPFTRLARKDATPGRAETPVSFGEQGRVDAAATQ